jgi:hypothetical protein
MVLTGEQQKMLKDMFKRNINNDRKGFHGKEE